MSLLGKAALVLSFDITAEAIVEHDDWHSHEHFQERMSLTGFLRGSRWVVMLAFLEPIRAVVPAFAIHPVVAIASRFFDSVHGFLEKARDTIFIETEPSADEFGGVPKSPDEG